LIKLYINLIKFNKDNMPNLNGTGPEGVGAGTGRGMGSCKSGQVATFNGRGMRGFGRLNPFCRFRSSLSKEDKKTFLGEEEKALKERLEEIKKEKENIE
jgi:hypothetical protein